MNYPLAIGESIHIAASYEVGGNPKPSDFFGPKLVTVNTSWTYREGVTTADAGVSARTQVAEIQVSTSS